MSPDKTQTCFWCHEQRPVDEDGRIAYHDYPVPCRMLCRGARRFSVEHIAATELEFRCVVGDYLEGGATLRVIVPELAEAMRREFPADSDWPRRLVAGTAHPHPLLRLKIVKWIGLQLRKERSLKVAVSGNDREERQVNEYREMSTSRLLRLLGSRNERSKHDASLRYYSSNEVAEYTDAMDDDIVEIVASVLEDRIDDARDTARRALTGPRP